MDLISMVPDVTTTLAAAACLVVLASLATSTLALRRSRALARSSAALVAELAVFKDAAVSLGQHLDRRAAVPAQPGHALSSHGPSSSMPLHAIAPSTAALHAPVIAPDTQRAFELARQGASIDDLVAACDVSRTEAGLMLAMSRRGRRVLAG